MIRAGRVAPGRSSGTSTNLIYTFQYATGISAAHALANGILAGDEPDAIDRYLGFLRAGNADYPIKALRAAGVDMSTPQAVEETFKVLEGLVDRLESLI